VDHGVNAGCGGYWGRQTNRQFRIEDSPVRQQLRCDHALLFAGTSRDDGNWCYFRSGSCGGRGKHQWQSFATNQIYPVHIFQFLLGVEQQCDEFCRVQRTTATNGCHAIDALISCHFHGLEYHGFGWIRLYITIGPYLQPGGFEAVQSRLGEAQLQYGLVGDEGYLPASACCQYFPDLARRPDFGKD